MSRSRNNERSQKLERYKVEEYQARLRRMQVRAPSTDLDLDLVRIEQEAPHPDRSFTRQVKRVWIMVGRREFLVESLPETLTAHVVPLR